MIIGGAWQGQLDWAQNNLEELKNAVWIDGETCEFEEIFTCSAIYNFHLYIRRLMEEGHSDRMRFLAQKLTEENAGITIVTDEIGYGIVPADSFERAWREQVGRTCTELAAFSELVVRVVMGIGTIIKRENEK